MLRIPQDRATPKDFAYCKRCPKSFLSYHFLAKHYAKTHPTAEYEADFPDHPIEDAELKPHREAEAPKQQAPPQIDTVKLHADLANSMRDATQPAFDLLQK